MVEAPVGTCSPQRAAYTQAVQIGKHSSGGYNERGCALLMLGYGCCWGGEGWPLPAKHAAGALMHVCALQWPHHMVSMWPWLAARTRGSPSCASTCAQQVVTVLLNLGHSKLRGHP